MIKFCSKYVFQYKIEYGIYFLLGIIMCGLNTFIPAAMGQFINMFNVETTYSAMLKFIFLLLLLYVGKEIVCYVNKILYIRIQTNAAFSLNFEIVNHLKKVSPLVIGRTDLSYLSQRINNDANDVLIFFISSLTELIFSVFSAGIILFMIWKMDSIAFIVTMFLLALYFFIYIGFNALKYSTGDIMFYMWGESEYCHIQISNPSDYISDEELKSIFDLFYTKDEARIKSSGIGLYATRKLVIQISGDIQVNYEAGIFTVSIKLPLI